MEVPQTTGKKLPGMRENQTGWRGLDPAMVSLADFAACGAPVRISSTFYREPPDHGSSRG